MATVLSHLDARLSDLFRIAPTLRRTPTPLWDDQIVVRTKRSIITKQSISLQKIVKFVGIAKFVS